MLTSIRLVLVAGAAALVIGAGSASAGTQSLNPPPPPDYSCKATGGGTICRAYNPHIVYGPDDTGIQCGSGADAFDIFDQGDYSELKTRWYDTQGNLTKRTIVVNESAGVWSSPLSGRTVPYTQTGVFRVVLAVPGDLSSATETDTGENIYRDGSGGGAPLFFATGRQVYNFELSELISSTPHDGFVAAFFQGDSHAFDAICAALR